MKGYFAAIFIACTILISCQQGQKHAPLGGFVVNGSIAGIDTGWIYLQHADTSSFGLDSVRIKDGKFSFTGKVSSPAPAYLWMGKMERGKYLAFFLTDTNVSIEFNRDSSTKSKVSAGADQVNFELYSQLLLHNKNKMNQLLEEGGKLSANAQSEERGKMIYDSLGKFYVQLQNDNVVIMESFVKTHPNSIISAWAVATSNLTYNAELDKLKMIYQQFSESVKNSKYGLRINKMIDLSERLAVGSVAPEFTANDTAGKPVALSSFRGKYLLLDFWASWCHPCREENPNVVDAYRKFKLKNFTILQVSLDENKENWLKAIHDDHLAWNHVSDLKGWNSAIGALYAIQSIPSNFLLDPSGKILAHNLRGSALQDTLSRLLGN